ncbi:MAG: hypothetical protein HKP30_07690 [Myxococcales bacterium]|nr:hypothetical protein [Myxococcales bacterium]
MKRHLGLGIVTILCAGCAGTGSDRALPAAPMTSHATFQADATPDLAVAGWRVPFECLELSERIESSQTRLYDAVAGMFSSVRATDERRLRALESRADELGCPVPGSPHSY